MAQFFLLKDTDINIFGYYDDYNVLHINGFHSASKYITIDNIIEFLKILDINFIYEPHYYESTSI